MFGLNYINIKEKIMEQQGFPPENYQQIFEKIGKDLQSPIFFHENSQKIAIIIDTRFDSIMQGVIRNFMYYMNPLGWNLMIYGLEKNRAEIQKVFENAIFREIPEKYLTKNGEDSKETISIENYNKIMMSLDFWDSIPYENICIFQRDCVMYKMFPEYFSDLYDYAGANYYTPIHTAPYYGGIQGGFSLRKKKCMIDCLINITWEIIAKYREVILKIFPGGNILGSPDIELKNEDIFFTYACEILRKNVPDKIHRSFLSIESDINLNTSVMHGWPKYYLPFSMVDILIKQSDMLSKYYE